MNSNDKQHYIYLRGINERVSVTKQEFDDYYRDINAFRRTQMNRGLCNCPQAYWLYCDMECHSCPYKCGTAALSTDITQFYEAGIAYSWIESIPDNSISVEEKVIASSEARQILERLQELMPEALEIGKLSMSGLSGRAIEQQLGIGRIAHAYRLNQVKEILEKEFPDYFNY